MRLTVANLANKIAELTVKHSNLPERYIKRSREVIYYKAPKLPQYRQIIDKRIKKHYDVDRSWTYEFQMLNVGKEKHKRIYVQPIKDWWIFKGDRVEILTGKDKGKHGIVVQIIQERNWVIVEGLNMYLKRLGATKTNKGMLTKVEAPLLVPNEVSLVDPTDMKPVTIEWRYNEKGEKVRVSSRSGRLIPMPVLEESTYDYKIKAGYPENLEKDTKAVDVEKITFVPELKTFEMSIMDDLGIQEDRVPAKFYWY